MAPEAARKIGGQNTDFEGHYLLINSPKFKKSYDLKSCQKSKI